MTVSSQYTPPDGPLDILHEDAQMVAVNKPAGLLSVPGRGEHLSDCLITRLQAAFPGALLVHRLDRDTSGVMVFALVRNLARGDRVVALLAAAAATVSPRSRRSQCRASTTVLPVSRTWSA